MSVVQRRWRSIVHVRIVLLAACLALVVVAVAGAAPPPADLIGSWTRTVSAKDVARAHSTKIAAGTTWTLVIASAKSSVRSGRVATYTGTITPAAPTLVHIELGGNVSNLYAWRRVGTTLIFTKKHDPSANRAAILVGTWKRR
jgi:hypothetical protein